MKNIAVFLDGTQNRCEGDRLSNVAKLFMLAETRTKQGDSQIKYYAPGVGVYRAVDKVWTVLSGVGVQVNLRLAYQFVCANYEPESRIFIFGFSRGAFSARHLAGLIARVGILEGTDIAMSREVYEWYRYTITGRDRARRFVGTPHPVQFLGMWDTVAAHRPFFFGGNRGFRGGRLEPEILAARHALAKDERRYSYYPEVYEGSAPQYLAEWFPGYHCDVGGGNPESQSGLSNAALRWMVVQAREHGFAAASFLGGESDAAALPTPCEFPWTRFLNRSRKGLYQQVTMRLRSNVALADELFIDASFARDL